MNINKLRHRFTLAINNPAAVIAFLRNRIASLCPGAKDPTASRIASWSYGKAPRSEINDIFPGIETVSLRVVRAFDRNSDTSVTAEEALYISAVVQHTRAGRILEIGTFDGNTTLNLAANTGENGMVVTVDLPPDWKGGLAMDVPVMLVNVTDRNTIGRQFKGAAFENRITQVFGDSAQLDWSSLGGPFDLIFIDGCHSYEYVKKDTENALANLTNQGVILWHDYGLFRDVSVAVDEFSDRMHIHVIQGTRIAVGTNKT